MEIMTEEKGDGKDVWEEEGNERREKDEDGKKEVGANSSNGRTEDVEDDSRRRKVKDGE